MGISGLLLTVIALILFGLTCKYWYSATFLVWVLIYFLMLMTPIEYLSKVNFLKIENQQDVEVSNKGILTLSSGTTAVTSSEYIVTDFSTVEDIDDYLQDQNKSVMLYVREGDRYLYKKNLGVIPKTESLGRAEEIITIYDSWKTTSKLPNEDTVVWLWKIYVKR